MQCISRKRLFGTHSNKNAFRVIGSVYVQYCTLVYSVHAPSEPIPLHCSRLPAKGVTSFALIITYRSGYEEAAVDSARGRLRQTAACHEPYWYLHCGACAGG